MGMGKSGRTQRGGILGKNGAGCCASALQAACMAREQVCERCRYSTGPWDGKRRRRHGKGKRRAMRWAFVCACGEGEKRLCSLSHLARRKVGGREGWGWRREERLTARLTFAPCTAGGLSARHLGMASLGRHHCPSSRACVETPSPPSSLRKAQWCRLRDLLRRRCNSGCLLTRLAPHTRRA